MISIALFWTYIGIGIAVIGAFIFIIARLHWLRKTDIDELKGTVALLETINEMQGEKLKHAMFRCNRCGRLISKPRFDMDYNSLCIQCWDKHILATRKRDLDLTYYDDLDGAKC